jgi:hypothetical protein
MVVGSIVDVSEAYTASLYRVLKTKTEYTFETLATLATSTWCIDPRTE